MRTTQTLHLACAALASLAASGCLSIDGVKVRGDGAAEEGFDDPDLRDGDEAPGDVDAASPGSLGQPCIDRGPYMLDGLAVQGMQDTCNGDGVCVAGVCQEEPVCAPGVDSACRIDFDEKRGPRSRVHGVGAYLYWLEAGSTDGLGNYRYDGALVRTKPGEWLREEVVSGLDFFSDEANQRADVELYASGRYLYATSNGLGTDAVRYDIVQGVVSSTAWNTGRASCASQDGTEITFDWSERTATVRETSGEQRSIASGVAVGTSCHLFDGTAWWRHGWPFQLRKLDTRDSSTGYYGPIDRLIHVDSEGVYQVAGNYVSVTVPGDSHVLAWRNVARVTVSRLSGDRYDSDFFVEGQRLTWSRVGTSRTNTVILRSTLGSDAPALVLAETLLSHHEFGFNTTLTERGVLYEALGEYGIRPQIPPHFVPTRQVAP